jgi:hypothetical protein
VDREIIEKVIEEARSQESNLVIWDRRDTFTIESQDLGGIEMNDGYLVARMQKGKAAVYVEHESIYKLVIEQERSSRSGSRAGFGTA